MPKTGPAAGGLLALSLLLILAGVSMMLVARGHRPADITPRRDRHASTE